MTVAAHPPLSFKQALLAMMGISLVLMLSALDQTVIGNALPSIVAELNGFELYAWVATGYLLASIVTIPIFGRLGLLRTQAVCTGCHADLHPGFAGLRRGQ